MKNLRIGLNLLHAQPTIGGGWNYISNLIAALGDFDAENEYIAYVTKESRSLVPNKPNFSLKEINVNPISRGQRVIYENSTFQMLVQRQKVDCIHWFANTQGLINSKSGVVTVYDLLVFRNPAQFPLIKRLYLKIWIRHTARWAKILLPMSQATAQDIGQILGVTNERMIVVPPVIPARFTQRSADSVADFRLKYQLPKKFWLYVAHMYQHKNHIRLLYAYNELRTQGFTPWPLVLVGSPKDNGAKVVQLIQELHLEDAVIILPTLDDAEMPTVYSAASALIFPSLFEGGGIPVAEAMACGCPVAAGDIPAIQEFTGENALFFAPTDIKSIQNALFELQSNIQLCQQLGRDGVRRIEAFKGKLAVQRLREAYRQAVV